MVRLNILLTIALVLCALGLVTSQDRARRLFVDVESADAQTARLEVRWNQLQIEQTALAKASLIDTKARSELEMQPVSPARTLHLVVDPLEHLVRLGSAPPALPKIRGASHKPAPARREPGAR